MSKKSNAIVIGLFTLVGIFIAGVALVVLGAGKHFEKTHKILLHFEKSVYGLQVGSDVRFGGVRIGRVASISVIIDTAENRKVLPVVVELADKELRKISGTRDGLIDFTSREKVKLAVEDGLRAGMKQASLVTGQLYVEFDMVPRVEGFIYETETKTELPVVPTIPTEMDALISGISDGLAKINSLDLEGLIREMQQALGGLNKQVADLQMKSISDNLVEITKDVREITSDHTMRDALSKLDAALLEIRQLGVKMNDSVDPFMKDLQGLVANGNQSLMRIEQAADGLGGLGDPRSPVLLKLNSLLHETETTSRALKELANDLKRNPNSLLRGIKRSP